MFTLTSNLDDCTRKLDDLTVRQLPFATSRALNDTVEDVRQAEVAAMRADFDRPTPFTLNAFRIISSTKASLVAIITTKDVQSKYLPMQAEGGTEYPPNLALLIPVHVALNAYGNLTRNQLKGLLRRPDVFVARQRNSKTRHLTPGVYQRGFADDPAPILLIKFKSSQAVRPIFKFEAVARATATKAFAQHFTQRLAEAMATAR